MPIVPIFVPMLMQLRDLARAHSGSVPGRRFDDQHHHPLMTYFPLVVFGQRYVEKTGIGTLVSIMLPYSAVFLLAWTILVLGYWMLGIPLGLQAPYSYPQPNRADGAGPWGGYKLWPLPAIERTFQAW